MILVGDRGAKEDRDPVRGQVLEYARAIYSGIGVDGVKNYSSLMRKVTPEQVKSVAGLYLDPQSLRIAIVRGKKR